MDSNCSCTNNLESKHRDTEACINHWVSAHAAAMENLKQITIDDHHKALQQVINRQAPLNALRYQEEAIQHNMQSPNKMDIQTYYSSFK